MKTSLLCKVFQSVAALLFAASVVIAGVLSKNNTADSAYAILVMANVGLLSGATVGTFLISAKSETAKRIGHGLTISAYAMGLTYALLTVTSEASKKEEVSTGAILMIIAVAFLAAFYFCKLLGDIMSKSSSDEQSPNNDPKIKRLKEWKQVFDEGFITEEEFEEKRTAILGMKDKTDETEPKTK